MKRFLTMLTLAFIMMLGSAWRNNAAAQSYADRGEVSYQTFYDELSPYGRWVDYPEYGYVWIPDAGPDFRPYSTRGHWVWSDEDEWMWVSDYDWGWAPFHYGRWNEDPNYGWFWVPGYEWSPAWVAWRDGGIDDDYYGWAPLRPGISIGINFSIGSYSPPYDYWNFAPRRYITSPRIYDYCYDRGQNITIINHTTIINNYSYNRNVFRTGPRRNDVERYAGRITPVRFRDADRPGRNSFRGNEVVGYRPNVQRDNENRFAPRSFERFDRNHTRDNNGIARTENRDGRGDNNFRRNDNVNDRNNNVPRTDRRDNTPIERRPDAQVRPQDNNNENGRFRRGNDLPVAQPRNDNNGNQPGNRNFDRRPVDVQRPAQTPSNNGNNDNNRRFDRRENNPVAQPRQFDRRENTPVTQPRRERTQDVPASQPRQAAPRTQQQTVPQPQRQFERRDNSGGNRTPSNNGGGGSRGFGRKN